MQIERKAPPKPAKKPDGERAPAKKPFDEVLKETREQAAPARTTPKEPGPRDAPSTPRAAGRSGGEDVSEQAPIRRRPPEEERRPANEESPTSAEAPAGLGAQPQNVAAGGAASIEGASAAATVQALADEITAVAGPEGMRELQVEVDSNVIDDLRISVSRDASGELTVRLMTDSVQTTKLLQDNLGQLSAALAARNVQTTAIHVTARVNPAASAAAAKSQRERDRRERGRR